MQILIKRRNSNSLQKIREFAIQSGLKPELRFCDLDSVYLYPVAADLNSGEPVVFGVDPMESVLDSVMVSMTLPPWLVPEEKDGRYLMDGGAVSNLPIEAPAAGCHRDYCIGLFNPGKKMNRPRPDCVLFYGRWNAHWKIGRLDWK